MLKKLIISVALFCSASAFAQPGLKECSVSRAEKLICANVMCDFGRIMGEDSAECRQYKVDLAVYLATLGPFSKPPKCKLRDENCKKTGNAKKAEVDEKYCKGLNTTTEQDACLAGKKVMDEDTSEDSDED